METGTQEFLRLLGSEWMTSGRRRPRHLAEIRRYPWRRQEVPATTTLRGVWGGALRRLGRRRQRHNLALERAGWEQPSFPSSDDLRAVREIAGYLYVFGGGGQVGAATALYGLCSPRHPGVLLSLDELMTDCGPATWHSSRRAIDDRRSVLSFTVAANFSARACPRPNHHGRQSPGFSCRTIDTEDVDLSSLVSPCRCWSITCERQVPSRPGCVELRSRRRDCEMMHR